MKPTAQAVGKARNPEEAPKGRKKIRTYQESDAPE
jgi:hypothetical protein